jgi:pimeloyl-ACP methyl ester carboxylesterase
MDATLPHPTETITLNGIEIAVTRRGKGAPVVLLTNEDGGETHSAFADALAASHEVIVPEAPGFGTSPDDERVTSIDDIAYLYLDLLDHLKLKDAILVGCSLGGWIAAEMATKTCQHLKSLTLIGSYGIKVGGPYDRDIADIYVLPKAEIARRTYADAAKAPDYAAMDEAAVTQVARNRLATVRYCWEPYMHNPKLKGRLHRILVPTVVLWGEQDGIVAPAYGRAFAAAIPGARFQAIPGAGHLPQLERPDDVLAGLGAFLKA